MKMIEIWFNIIENKKTLDMNACLQIGDLGNKIHSFEAKENELIMSKKLFRVGKLLVNSNYENQINEKLKSLYERSNFKNDLTNDLLGFCEKQLPKIDFFVKMLYSIQISNENDFNYFYHICNKIGQNDKISDHFKILISIFQQN